MSTAPASPPLPAFTTPANWAHETPPELRCRRSDRRKMGTLRYRSWALRQSSLEMLEPGYSPLDAVPLALVRQARKVRAPVKVIFAPLRRGPASPDPARLEEEFDRIHERMERQTQRVRWCSTSALITLPHQRRRRRFQRLTDKELSDLANCARAGEDQRHQRAQIPRRIPTRFCAATGRSARVGARDQLSNIRREQSDRRTRNSTARKAHSLYCSPRTPTIATVSMFAQKPPDPMNAAHGLATAPASPFPAAEQYNRLVRLAELSRSRRRSARHSPKAGMLPPPTRTLSISSARIPGGVREKMNSIMIGAHFEFAAFLAPARHR